MKCIFVFIIVLSNFLCQGQVIDDFSDGDFQNNPIWAGDTSSWRVTNGSLKSNNIITNSQFYLSTRSEIVKNVEWEILVNLQFNTSSANYVDLFLVSDSSNLKSGVKNGYFVRIGGAKDEICLYRKLNGVTSVLIDGIDGVTNKSANTIALKVSCNEGFQWSLARNILGQASNYTSEGVVIDSTIKTSKSFGILVAQSTASFFQKHLFDNISVKKVIKDTLAPVLTVSSFVKSLNPFTISFNEEVDSSWVYSTNNFQLYDVNGLEWKIDKIQKDVNSNNIYHLFVTDETIGQGNYILKIHNAKDVFGNVAKEELTFDIAYYKPLIAIYNQIVITELMPDPVPSVGLPEKEYVEIYNNSNTTFDLKDYVFADPTTSVKLPSYFLLPNEYLIVCKKSDSLDFGQFGKVLPLNVMPSLNNSSDVISILNPNGTLVDRVSYQLSWYKDSHKDDGGYSLELIDPTNRCLTDENWRASSSKMGGTPGSINSVYAILKDEKAPFISSITPIYTTQIEVFFSEKVDSVSLNISNFIFSSNLIIESMHWKADSLNKVLISFANPLPKRTDLSIKINTLKDCAGNVSYTNLFDFGIPEKLNFGDVLVNEVLFNPLPYGADFVEVYNNSEKYIDLKGCMLANLKNDTIANRKVLVNTSFILKPREYLVFTDDKDNILNTYVKSHVDRIVKVAALPTYYDDIGNVILLDASKEVIDRFDYDQTMHSSLLSKKEGVSLEKIHPSLTTNDRNNWTSASKESGYATPGYANSQYISLGISDDDISIEPRLITPNGDGDKDFLVVSIQTDKIGLLRNIIIFDMLGREVKRLLQNGFAGTHSLIQWDGTDESNNLAPLGHYIFWLEAVDKSGNVVHCKKKVVVGTRF